MGTATGSVRLVKRQRGDQWYLKYRLPSGRQAQKRLGPAAREKGRPELGTFTRKQAEAELQALLTDIRRGEIPDPGDRMGKAFADAVAAWMHYVEHDKARRPSTVRGYESVAKVLLEEFGKETALETIDTARIDTYRQRLLKEGELSRRTVQQRMVLLHGVMKRARALGWIRENPAERVERVNLPPTGEFNILSVEQLEAVATKAVGMFSAAILIAGYTGLRTGELRALRWRDVDFAGATLRVERNMPIGGEEGRPKSGKGRSVPLMDDAARALDGLSRRENFTDPEDRVFGTVTGEMLDRDALRDALYAAMKAAAIDRRAFPARGGFTFHDLRHTFGTLAVQVFPLVDVQAYMGHADISTTMRYAHHVPKVDAARRFTESIQEARGETVSPTGSRTAENNEKQPATTGTNRG